MFLSIVLYSVLLVLAAAQIEELQFAANDFNWTTVANVKTATAMASDASGKHLVTVSADDVIYYSSVVHVSKNWGKNWTTFSPPTETAITFTSVTTDATGQYMAVASYQNVFYFSQDFGVTWFNRSSMPKLSWQSIVSDDTGAILFASASAGTGSDTLKGETIDDDLHVMRLFMRNVL